MATVPLGLYLWKRIHEVGVRTIMGLPGDFNLQLLDQIYEVPELRWVGNANELNAAYAADGYARINGAGCIVTTHGVGELSALNGIAGAMTEQVKVIHVVGQTTRSMQKKRQMIHHSIGFSPDHQMYNKASQAFRVAAAELQDVETAPAEIDRVLRECFLKSCPVYIFIPLDMVDEHVSADLLEQPIDLSLPHDLSMNQSMDSAASAIMEALSESKNPVIMIDCLIQRHQAIEQLKELVEKLKFPIYASNMGKGIIDETHPLYVGIYNGTVSSPGLREAFEASDLILLFGNLPSDTNSGGFSRKTPSEKTIDFRPTEVVVRGNETFQGTHYRTFLPFLTEKLSAEKLPQVQVPTLPLAVDEADIGSKSITQSWIWQRIVDFLRPNDALLGETGTAAFGIPDARFPRDITWITQTYYGSIGYATPATLGVDLAVEELAARKTGPRGRTVLATGDGSLQLTLQEIGTMIHYGAKPVIFLINNDGYTIERVIHGARQKYNDIVPYNWGHTLQLFGMSDAEAKQNYHRCRTKTEFDEIVAKASVRNPEKVQIIEVVMDAFDVPWRLVSQIGARGEAAVKKMEDAGFKVRKPVVKTNGVTPNKA